MAFFVRIPSHPDPANPHYTSERYLNIIQGDGSFAQRTLRRAGYGGYERDTAATLCAIFELLHDNEEIAGWRSWGEREGRKLVFYDVGANGGFYAFLCRCLYGDSAEVVAFEPAPATYASLSNINRANGLGVHTVEAAVSDESGTATLYLSPKSDASNSMNAQFKHAEESVQVPKLTLDDYVRQNPCLPNVIKIDTETHESAVLKGASQLLRARRPFLAVEALNKGGVDYGKRISRTLESLAEYHYYRITPGGGLEQHARIFAEPKAAQRDWLVSPVELGEAFSARVQAWNRSLEACTASTHVVPRALKAPDSKAPPKRRAPWYRRIKRIFS